MSGHVQNSAAGDGTTGFLDVFDSRHPILAMLHLAGGSDREVFDQAREEIDLLYGNGVDAVIVENYFGTVPQVERVLEYLAQQRPGEVYGINVLGDDARAFELANAFGAAFIQLDSVAGHLVPEDDAAFAEDLAHWRARSRCFVLGGVRFKYQPVLSGNSVETDLRIGRERCDGIVVSSDGTGIETSPAKIARFREVLGEGVPLIVGAGLTVENAAEQLRLADGAIVGSYFKDTYRDTGKVDAEHVRALVGAVRAVSAERTS